MEDTQLFLCAWVQGLSWHGHQVPLIHDASLDGTGGSEWNPTPRDWDSVGVFTEGSSAQSGILLLCKHSLGFSFKLLPISLWGINQSRTVPQGHRAPTRQKEPPNLILHYQTRCWSPKLWILTVSFKSVFWVKDGFGLQLEYQKGVGSSLWDTWAQDSQGHLITQGRWVPLVEVHIAPPLQLCFLSPKRFLHVFLVQQSAEVGVKAPSSLAPALPPPCYPYFLVQAHPLVELAACWHLADLIVKLTKLINHKRLIGVTRLERRHSPKSPFWYELRIFF